VCPGARVGDLFIERLERAERNWGNGGRERYVKVVSSFLRREFASFLDEIPELRFSPLELAALVGGQYPVCNFAFCLPFVSPHPGLAFRVVHVPF